MKARSEKKPPKPVIVKPEPETMLNRAELMRSNVKKAKENREKKQEKQRQTAVYAAIARKRSNLKPDLG